MLLQHFRIMLLYKYTIVDFHNVITLQVNISQDYQML